MHETLLTAEMDLPGVNIQIIDFQWPADYSGMEAVDGHVLSLSLTPIPRSSRGQLDGTPGMLEPLGRLLFMPSRTCLNAKCDGGFQRILRCRFSEGCFESMTQHGPNWMPDELLNSLDLRSMPLVFGLQRIAHEVRAPDFGSAILIESILDTLATDLVQKLGRTGPKRNYRGGLSPRRLSEVEGRIGEAALPLPTVSELADGAVLSSRHLLRAYKATTGITLRARLQQEGRSRAMKLLGRTDRSIGEIAVQLGFQSQASFASAFRHAVGESPSAYRRRMH